MASRKGDEHANSDNRGFFRAAIFRRIGQKEKKVTQQNAESTVPEQHFYCYMVLCSNGAFYTGWTTDPVHRVKIHNAGQGAAYTKMHCPVTLVYMEELPSRHDAMLREIEIKKMSRDKKSQMSEEWLKNKQ